MGCSLSAASDRQDDRNRLHAEAANNASMKKYYMLLHSINRDIREKQYEKRDLKEEMGNALFQKFDDEEKFNKLLELKRNDAFLLEHELEMLKNNQQKYAEKIKDMIDIGYAVHAHDIIDVADDKRYDY
jgi:hypothetical protein